MWTLDVDLLADLIEEFVTGNAPAPLTDRLLASVLFTDLVGSTERATELGDAPGAIYWSVTTTRPGLQSKRTAGGP